MRSGVVGIIANPASGKDIRRLVAHASTFDNNEKINIVRRALLGMDAVGVAQVWYLPDSYNIVVRAANGVHLALELYPLPMDVIGNASDSFEAAARLAQMGAGALLTLGGDGTNRSVVKGCGAIPLVAISTGTNNVFPRMVEGTLAGMAAGLVAIGAADEAVRQVPRLDVSLDGVYQDLALVDVVTSPHQWIGARAVWEPEHIREIVLARIGHGEIGICSLGGMLFPEQAGQEVGAHIVIGQGGGNVRAPLAPGIIREVPIACNTLLVPDQSVALQPGKGTIALDGERELELLRDDVSISVHFNPAGPNVVSIPQAINLGARAGILSRQ